MMEENIAAIATPPGKGGVAIIRISGKSPLALAEKIIAGSQLAVTQVRLSVRDGALAIDCM